MKFINTEDNKAIISRLMSDMDFATCNFLAVKRISEILKNAGFVELFENAPWEIVPNGKYFLTKNNSAIFAFIIGNESVDKAGFRIISAHTDSPCFKIKPNCEIYGDGGVVSLNVEKYGGGIMYTWFDRPLSISGRVLLRTADPLNPQEIIIDLKRPVATIPHLAIHFNRAVNDGNPLSVQKDMKPVVGYFEKEEIEKFKEDGGVIKRLVADSINQQGLYDREVAACDILDYELCLYPAEKASLVGINEEYLQTARIDDLSMAFAGLEALLAEAGNNIGATRILALFDNEETGSGTKQGAASPVLRHIMQRISMLTSDTPEAYFMALGNSFMISADDAHGRHPNYSDKYDPTNHPVLGGGPVVKINANCKYMTDGRGAAIFHSLCEKADVPMQYFVNHSDVAGGSTLGNISSTQFDIEGVDVGCAIWAMHSARETCSVADHIGMIKVFRQFLI